MRTSRLLATPGTNFPRSKAPAVQHSPKKFRPTPTAQNHASAVAPLSSDPSPTNSAHSDIENTSHSESNNRGVASGEKDEDGSKELEQRFFALSETLKATTEQLHAAHVECRRYKQIIRTMSDTGALPRASSAVHLASPSYRSDYTLGNSAFDRKVVGWLVRSGTMSSGTAAAEEEQARQKLVISQLAQKQDKDENCVATPEESPVSMTTVTTAHKLLSISLDLEAEDVQNDDDCVDSTTGKDGGGCGTQAEPSDNSKVDCSSPTIPADGSQPLPSAQAVAVSSAPTSAPTEKGVEQIPGRGEEEAGEDDSSVDSGFGELGVDELPDDHVRLDENRLRIGHQTPHIDDVLDDLEDDTMALIYSKPGIATSAVYISATDLYIILMQELMDLKQVLNNADDVFYDFYSQGYDFS